ncbi:biopolymer transporter ExbD [Devosia chinhatensis]|uniref:biopolymer transporter ExbD n=1 Tax=Devosia chinhatensis TaxID=429727 RepID=UPI000698D761|nr:biopolymer transporter ExbD [Devosia chinhatensis]
MGMGSVPGGGRNLRGRGRIGASRISEINVTPMVDVMRGLLIVFMVAAPVMTMGVPITLPKTDAQAMPIERKPITVTVAADGTLSIDGAQVGTARQVEHVSALAVEGTDHRLDVRD